ncbi:ABC transporter substrate-binding protein [Pseudonocardia sp. MH-G8]|uniref:ABC transporter substrate-binding protein n=1 Tax=Pseudonocardia sp. MH-G8 TaxID=1854588 RepID=UPI000BA16BC6|nr:ABC transporter substrate-binding protein [Pseudonocardia sp. MH-G8]OZM77950.1 sugar ABC transporter substrate-binding protein [Pseudonocardia sp. MH-G8]
MESQRMPLRRRRLGSAAAAVATAIVLLCSACGGGADPRGGPVELTWYVQPLNSTPVFEELVAAFNEAHPDIHVNLEVGPTDVDVVRGALATQIGSGSATPDVYEGDIIWPAQFARGGLAEALTDHFPESFWDRFAPGLAEAGLVDGEHYNVPLLVEASFLYYREDLLEQAGVPVPRTWEELLAAARALQESGAVEHGFVWQGATYEGLTCVWAEMLRDAGGSIVDDDYQRATINSPEAVRALRFLKQTIDTQATPAAVTSFREPESLNAFNAGDAAFMRNWSYAWAITQDPASSSVVGKVGMAPLPTFDGRPYPGTSTAGGGQLYINPNSEHLEESAALIDWLTGPQAQTLLAEVGKVLPANVEVQGSAAAGGIGPAGEVLPTLDIVGRPAGTAEYSKISRAVFQNINAALAGTVPVEDALAAAESQIDEALSSGR